jgi:hypothetical protein
VPTRYELHGSSPLANTRAPPRVVKQTRVPFRLDLAFADALAGSKRGADCAATVARAESR